MKAEYLNDILIYNAETGALNWSEKKRGKHRGSTAGYVRVQRGLKTRRINIDESNYRADKIIMQMKTGIDPVDVIHLDGDYLNNAWDNLQPVDFIVRDKPRAKPVNLYKLPASLERSLQEYFG